jgi:hypothetical protein
MFARSRQLQIGETDCAFHRGYSCRADILSRYRLRRDYREPNKHAALQVEISTELSTRKNALKMSFKSPARTLETTWSARVLRIIYN